MMNNLLGFASARLQSRASLLKTWLDGATVKIYDGTRPATADTAIDAQVLLCTIVLSDPSGAAVNGVWTVDPIPSPVMVAAAGTAAWARAIDSSSGLVCDMDVGVVGSGAAIEIDNVSLVLGAMATVLGMTIVEG